VIQQVHLSWDVRQLILRQLATQWHTLNAIALQLDALWQIEQIAASNNDLRWHINIGQIITPADRTLNIQEREALLHILASDRSHAVPVRQASSSLNAEPRIVTILPESRTIH
jgi:hypothetical protein